MEKNNNAYFIVYKQTDKPYLPTYHPEGIKTDYSSDVQKDKFCMKIYVPVNEEIKRVGERIQLLPGRVSFAGIEKDKCAYVYTPQKNTLGKISQVGGNGARRERFYVNPETGRVISSNGAVYRDLIRRRIRMSEASCLEDKRTAKACMRTIADQYPDIPFSNCGNSDPRSAYYQPPTQTQRRPMYTHQRMPFVSPKPSVRAISTNTEHTERKEIETNTDIPSKEQLPQGESPEKNAITPKSTITLKAVASTDSRPKISTGSDPEPEAKPVVSNNDDNGMYAKPKPALDPGTGYDSGPSYYAIPEYAPKPKPRSSTHTGQVYGSEPSTYTEQITGSWQGQNGYTGSNAGLPGSWQGHPWPYQRPNGYTGPGPAFGPGSWQWQNGYTGSNAGLPGSWQGPNTYTGSWQEPYIPKQDKREEPVDDAKTRETGTGTLPPCDSATCTRDDSSIKTYVKDALKNTAKGTGSYLYNKVVGKPEPKPRPQLPKNTKPSADADSSSSDDSRSRRCLRRHSNREIKPDFATDARNARFDRGGGDINIVLNVGKSPDIDAKTKEAISAAGIHFNVNDQLNEQSNKKTVVKNDEEVVKNNPPITEEMKPSSDPNFWFKQVPSPSYPPLDFLL